MPTMEERDYDYDIEVYTRTTFSPNQSRFDAVSETFATFINLYYTPVLIVFGTIGNTLSIVVFRYSKPRLQSTSTYLTALAVTDSVFLLLLLPSWLYAIQFIGVYYRPILCQLFIYLSYVACCMSTWIVVAFTVERFVAVVYPLRRNSICTLTRARYFIGVLVLCALVLELPVLLFTESAENDCYIKNDYIIQAARFNMADTVLSFTIPLGLIIILNVCIMIGMYRVDRARRELMKAEAHGRSPRAVRVRLPEPYPRSQRRVTRMLLIVSSVFVVLNLPAYTMRIVAFGNYIVSIAARTTEGEYTGHWASMQQICLCIFNTNFGINFMLYCLCGRSFRRAVLRTIPQLRMCVPPQCAENEDPGIRRMPRAFSESTSCVSACTEHRAAADPERHTIPRRVGTVIRRWKFDNSRPTLAVRPPPQQEIEMAVISSDPPIAGPSGIGREVSCDPEAATVRTIPYNLFPYKNLIVKRKQEIPRVVVEMYD